MMHFISVVSLTALNFTLVVFELWNSGTDFKWQKVHAVSSCIFPYKETAVAIRISSISQFCTYFCNLFMNR